MLNYPPYDLLGQCDPLSIPTPEPVQYLAQKYKFGPSGWQLVEMEKERNINVIAATVWYG